MSNNTAVISSSKIVFEGAGSGLTQTEQTDKVVNLFSTTLHSLAADAAAVRQAASLAHCLGISNTAKPNDNNNVGSGEVVNNEIANQLWDLDDLVKSLEDKVSALRQIVLEEKRALLRMETDLQPEADAQVIMLEQLLQAMEQQSMSTAQEAIPPQQKHQDSLYKKGDDYVVSNDGDEFDDNDNRSTASDTSSSSHPKKRSSSRSRRRGSSRRDSVDPRSFKNSSGSSSADGGGGAENQDPSIAGIVLPRITAQEFEDYKAENTLGPRISTSLLDLNEALEEIEQVCQRQRHAALTLKRKQQQHLLQQGGGVGNSNNGATTTTTTTVGSVQRRYQYLQKRQQLQHGTSTTTSFSSLLDDGGTTTATDHEPEPVTITEQELRESCPFFRHGESTARATLSLLCRLKRLKQIPNKNRNVTYHLLLLEQEQNQEQG